MIGVGLTEGVGRQTFKTGKHVGVGVGVEPPGVGVGEIKHVGSGEHTGGVGSVGVGVGEIKHVGSGEQTLGGVGSVGVAVGVGVGVGGSVINGGSVMTGVGGSVITGVGGSVSAGVGGIVIRGVEGGHTGRPHGVCACALVRDAAEEFVLAEAISPIPRLDIANTTAAASPPITQRGQPGLPRRLM